ncbi:MAG: TMEM175 family protein, partial [Xanthomonadales bacterium]|nr:TMEM175 family protein [Xanthomonadales bacterium]
MIPLKPEFIDNCPVENGFRLRGLDMTRIEVFVDAAFAFAVTMLVISFDAIPTTYDEMILAIKSIPAFVVAVVQIVWIWQTHNTWSRRFGLETAWTVVLSTALLIVVLIYIYPLRIMAGGMFSWFTSGYLPTNFNLETMDQLRVMFVFLGIGFMALCLVFTMMYRYAERLREPLLLSERELYRTRTVQYLWTGAGGTGFLCVVLALALPVDRVPFSGFAFALLAGWFPLLRWLRGKKA